MREVCHQEKEMSPIENWQGLVRQSALQQVGPIAKSQGRRALKNGKSTEKYPGRYLCMTMVHPDVRIRMCRYHSQAKGEYHPEKKDNPKACWRRKR